MADTKITALTAISTVDPAIDVLPIVDVSDTTMAASGTTKKITSNQILGAGGTATLASATITGDLTVDTNTLKVDSAGNRVIIGATSVPDTFLKSYITDAAAGTVGIGTGFSASAGYQGTWTNHPYVIAANGTEQFRVAPLGVFTFSDGAGGTRMTLNSTGLGVGVSPSAARLEVGGQDGTQLYIRSTGTIPSKIRGFTNAAEAGVIGFLNGGGIYFDISGERARLDASGNLLVGTTTNTPSARLYVNQASGSNPGIYIAGGAGTTPLINFNGAGSMRSDGQYLVMETTNASGIIYVTANTNGVYLAVGGTSWTANSDERLKDIIEPIGNAVAKVGSLRSVIGKFKTESEGTRRAFLIAQDVQKVLPEAVDASNPDRLGVGYSEVIPLLVAAIKELTARVEALEA